MLGTGPLNSPFFFGSFLFYYSYQRPKIHWLRESMTPDEAPFGVVRIAFGGGAGGGSDG